MKSVNFIMFGTKGIIFDDKDPKVVWWLISLFPALWVADCELEAGLGYIQSSRLDITTQCELHLQKWRGKGKGEKSYTLFKLKFHMVHE